MRRTLVGLALFGIAYLAPAATFTPTRFDDPAPDTCLPTDCSLREAVIAANATVAGDDILLGAGEYLLQRQCSPDTADCGDLDVTAELGIVGAGSASTFITNTTNPTPSYTNAYESRVLDVRQAALTLKKLGLRRGVAQGSAYIDVPGGCIQALQASLQLGSVVVSDCRSHYVGGAIYLDQSKATFGPVTLSHSWASGGGGLALSGSSTVYGTQVHIRDNDAYWGGGIVSMSGTNALHLADQSTIAQNRVTPTYGDRRGGGVLVLGGSLSVDSDNDAGPDWLRIEANEAGVDGGGASVAASSLLTLSQVRVRGNLADVEGGGVHVRGRLVLRDAEVALNVAGSHGGGVSLLSDASPSSRLERVSFHANAAGGNGGAVAMASPRVWLENISSHANTALGTGGGFHIAAQPYAFRFNTSLGDLGQGGSAVHAAAPLQVKGNIFGGSCTGAGTVTNLGHNVRGRSATGCVGTTMAADQMGLAYGDWGGPFDLIGFGPGSLLVGFVPSTASPPLRDARGFLRAGPSYDPGGYEHDAH